MADLHDFQGTGTTVRTTITTGDEPVVTKFVDDAYRAYPLTDIYTPECGSAISFEDFDTNCAPPHAEDIWMEDGYYSPALCFSGYTAGCSLSYRAIKPGQTAYNCVPSGYDCSTYTFQAVSTNNDGEYFTVPAFEIRWESSDLANLETHPLAVNAVTDSSTGGSSRTGSGPEVTGELKPADTDGDKTSGVPMGAAVGIAIGAAAFVAVVCGAAFILYRKRRQKKDAAPAMNSDSSSLEKPGGPVLYGGPPVRVQATELAGVHYHTTDAAELHGRDLLPELPPTEVEGSPAGAASPVIGTDQGFQIPRRPVGEAGAAATGI